MDTYLNKLRGLASSAANAVQSKIGRDYDVNLSGTPLGEAGLWSLFKATRRNSGQTVTVWVFEKRYFEQGINRQLFTTREQNLVIDLLKREASQLTRLRHPSVLQVVEPLEETRGSLMFVTEQVIASLDDLVNPDNGYGNGWSGSSGRMVDGEEYELDELEIQKGLLQVSKGLQFLHNDAKIVHGSLVPASILINAKGDWKLGGLGFAKHLNYGSKPGQHGDVERISFEHDYQLPSHTQQNLDFLAPEFVLDSNCSGACDLFSLGCLAFAVHSDGSSPLDCRNDTGAYRREVSRLAQDKFSKLPEYLAPVVRSLLITNPAQRLTLEQFQTSKYFDNILVATLRYLDAIVEQPQDQKIAFMKGLAKVLPKFPERVLRRKILQGLLDQTNDHALLPFTLPNVFYIVEKLTSKEFASLALPGLKPIFSVLDPPQTSIVLLDNISLLQKKVPGTVFRVDIMPLLYNALTSTQPQVQDKALQAVPNIAEFIDYTDLKDQLFPRIQHLYSKANVLSLKIRALMCLHGMLKSLDKNMIIDKLLPLLKRTKTREPGVIMTMLVMYEEIGLKYMDREMLAKEILPILWAQSVDTQLKLDQFKKFMQTIRRLSDRVENEQMKHLEQVRKIEVQTSRSGGGSGGDGLGMDFSIEQEDGDIGGGGGGGGGGFASLVMNKSDGNILVNPLASADLNGKQANVLQNPLASVASPATSPKPSSGWEWDASTFESNALAPSTTTNGNGAKSGSSLAFGKTIPVDYTSSSINGDDDDDFGSFGSFVPPPPPSSSSTAQRPGGNTPVTSTLAAKQVSARLRTTTTGSQPTQGRLGATRLQSQSTTANAFSATLPKPPSSNTGQAKPNYSLNANAFASTPVIQPMNQTSSTSRPSFGSTPVLTPSISKKHQSSNSQSHAGGKSAHLGDFDPFA